MERKIITLKKGNTEVDVDLHGAQIVSMRVDGVEVMFQGANDSQSGVEGKASGHEYFLAVEPWNCSSRVINELTTRDKTRDIKGMPVIEPGEQSRLEARVRVNPEYIKLFEPEQEQGKQ